MKAIYKNGKLHSLPLMEEPYIRDYKWSAQYHHAMELYKMTKEACRVYDIQGEHNFIEEEKYEKDKDYKIIEKFPRIVHYARVWGQFLKTPISVYITGKEGLLYICDNGKTIEIADCNEVAECLVAIAIQKKIECNKKDPYIPERCLSKGDEICEYPLNSCIQCVENLNRTELYWKTRCLLAEKAIQLPNEMFQKAYNEWLKFKN